MSEATAQRRLDRAIDALNQQLERSDTERRSLELEREGLLGQAAALGRDIAWLELGMADIREAICRLGGEPVNVARIDSAAGALNDGTCRVCGCAGLVNADRRCLACYVGGGAGVQGCPTCRCAGGTGHAFGCPDAAA